MKKLFFSLIMVLAAAVGMSQTIGEAFYVYRNDGMINTFFRSEIDSIAYSYYDADSLLYDEIVSQVVYTPDSIYQIPLAVIDSVGFVTPETKYQPNVIRIEGEIRNYILDSDSLTLYFRSDTPNNILPKIGDKLITTEMSDVFQGGFIGQVEQKELRNDTIAMICSAIGLEDVFECFYYSCQNEISTSGSRRIAYSPGPFVFSHTSFLDASIQPVDSPISFSSSSKFETKITPTFSGKGSIIVHPLKGVVISLDIKQRNTITEDLAFTGGISISKDFTPGPIPLCAIIPFVYIYGEVGVFIEAGLKASIEQHYSQSLNYNIHYEVSYLPIAGLPIATSVPKLLINGCKSESSFDAKCMLDGSISGGLYGEIGIALVSKRIASTGFRIKAGLNLRSNVMLYNSDCINSLNSTSPYNKLNADYVAVSAFYNVGSKTQLLKVGKLDINVVGDSSVLTKIKLVPNFSNTTLKRDITNSLHTIEATTTASGETLIPCTLGFRLFENGGTDSFKGPYTYQYLGLTGKPETYSDSYYLLPLTKSYTVYPTVELLGIEMLAEPSAEIGIGVTPVTLDVNEIDETTAKVYGKIDGFELLSENADYGIGIKSELEEEQSLIRAMNINDSGVFSVDLVGLEPNTKYTYFAYLDIDGQRIFGEEKEFTTTNFENAKAYAVLSDNTLTFYYDDKQKKRVGRVFNISFFNSKYTYYEGWYEDVHIIDFAPSFIYYTPTSTYYWFYSFRNLAEVRNINRLNTSKTTSMGGMFGVCSSLKSLDLRSFDTSNVTSMQSMFSGCSSLTDLDISSFDTSNVTNMGGMFFGCSSLTDLDISSFDTRKVTIMRMMFGHCSSIKILDLSHFMVTNGTYVDSMFNGCSSLTTIYAGNWSSYGNYTFTGCFNLIGEKGTKVGINYYINENGVQGSYNCSETSNAAHIDGGKDWPGLFTAK